MDAQNYKKMNPKTLNFVEKFIIYFISPIFRKKVLNEKTFNPFNKVFLKSYLLKNL